MRRWVLVVVLGCSVRVATAATITVTYTEPVVAGGALDYCETVYCTSTSTAGCTPTILVPNSQLKSDDGNGGDAKTLVRDIPVVSGQSHVTTATYCVNKNGNRGALSTPATCPGGTGCV